MATKTAKVYKLSQVKETVPVDADRLPLARLSRAEEPQGHVPPHSPAFAPLRVAGLQATRSERRVPLEFPAAGVILYFVVIRGGWKTPLSSRFGCSLGMNVTKVSAAGVFPGSKCVPPGLPQCPLAKGAAQHPAKASHRVLPVTCCTGMRWAFSFPIPSGWKVSPSFSLCRWPT